MEVIRERVEIVEAAFDNNGLETACEEEPQMTNFLTQEEVESLLAPVS